MLKNKPTKTIVSNKSFSFFEIFSFYWIVLAILFLILALLDLFKKPILVGGIIIISALPYLLFKKKIISLSKFTEKERSTFFAIIVFCLILSFFITPTIFGGRDEGSFSNAAILLSNDGGLTHKNPLAKTLHELYGTGKALNFPGFNYIESGELKSQFLPGYTAWLGALFGLGKLTALKFANLFPLITLLFSFYLISQRIINNKFATYSTILFATASPLIILNKFTLTEIFFAALTWFSLYLLLRYLENKRCLSDYWLIFLPLSLTIFVRIEAIAIIFMLFLILLLFDFNNLKKAQHQLPFFLLGLLVLLAISFNPNFFAENVKNIAKNLAPFITEKIHQSNQESSASVSSPFPNGDWTDFYLAKVLFNYHLLIWFLLTAIALFYLVRKKQWTTLIPFLFFTPTLIYLLDANISLDHPWMLRRFIFSLIPLSVLYGIFLLNKIKNKKLSLAIILIILLANLWQALPFAFKSQNKNLFTNLNEITREFSNNDLVLVSQKSTGSGWLLLSEPIRNIYKIPSVYFFRPSDLNVLSSNYTNVYLLVHPSELDLFKEIPKQSIKELDLINQTIPPSRNPLEKPQWQTLHTKLILYKLN